MLGSVAGLLLERAIRTQVVAWTPQTRRVLAPMLALPVVRTRYPESQVPDTLAASGFPELLSGWRRGRFPELDPLRARDWGHLAAYSLDPDGHVLAFAAAP